MKRFYCALLLAFAPLTTGALAQDTPKPPQPDTRPYIYIEASAHIEVPADQTRIALSLSEKRKTSVEASKFVADKMAQFNAALTKLGVPESSVETTSFDFSKVYIIALDKKGVPVSTVADPDRDKLDGYRATYDAVVTLGTTEKIGDVLTRASALGIEVTSVTFGTSKEADYVEQVRKLAADKARTRAEVYAATLGGTLGDLLNVKEGSGYNPDTMGDVPSDGYADLAVASEPAAAAMNIAPGKLTFSSSIASKWELGPPK